jgi:hypothetical protein
VIDVAVRPDLGDTRDNNHSIVVERTPFSVMSAVTRAAGVMSKAGL